MREQLKIYISSTYNDLKEYRKLIIDELTVSRFTVLAMENFGAQEIEPLATTFREIDKCDIFIGIYAYRYGYIPDNQNMSIIELEYNYAKERNKPSLCFLVDENQPWRSSMIEETHKDKLYAFKRRIQSEKVVDIFTTPDDLAAKVRRSIQRLIDSNPNFEGSKTDIAASDELKEKRKSPQIRKRKTKNSQSTKSINDNLEVSGDLGYLEVDKRPKTDSDRPSGPDRLNYKQYADAFAKILLNYETSTPLTIGIYGQWGQGKSFLMGKIKEALRNQRTKLSFIELLIILLRPFEPYLRNLFSDKDLDLLEKFYILSDAAISGFIAGYNVFIKKSRLILKDWESILVNPALIIENYKKRNTVRRKERLETVDFHIVEFNAWAYVGTDHLWAGLVTHLYKEVEKYFGLQLQIARFGKAIKKSLPKSILIFVFYGLLGFGLSLLLNYNDIKAGWENIVFAMKSLAGVAIGGTALAGLPILLTTLKEFIDSLFLSRSKNLQNLAAKPDFSAQIGIMADIKDEIRFMGKLLRKGKHGHPTRFILFIDDLDRCEHTKAVEVMQAIMLLLTDEDGAPFVIFMGIDARVIVHAIEANYEEVLVKAGINGYEYLDKIVQIPFVIPSAPLEDIKRYVDSMLWSEEEKALFEKKKALAQPVVTPPPAPPVVDEPPKQPEVALPSTPLEEISVSFTEIERMAINDCAKDLVDNPRKIKRIINIYRYARLILPAEQDRPKAIRWYLMVEQWPLHIAWIIEYIENDQQQTTSKLKGKTISDVYKLVKKNIRSEDMESLLAIDADPENFVSFIKKHDFTVQEVFALLPITFNLNPAIRSEVSKQMLKTSAPKSKRKKPASHVNIFNTTQST